MRGRATYAVGTDYAGAEIQEGQPIAVRKASSYEERRAFERLKEAQQEGERGLKQHEERRQGDIAFQRQQSCFRGPEEPQRPKDQPSK